jgi:hypothetical protein
MMNGILLDLASTGKCTTAVEIQNRLETGMGKKVSTMSILRALRRNGIRAHSRIKKPLLRKIADKKDSLSLANTDIGPWTTGCAWFGPMKIYLFGSDGRRTTLRRRGEQLRDHHVTPTVKHGGGSIML